MAFRDLFRPKPTPGTRPIGAGGGMRLRSPFSTTTPTELVYADVFPEGAWPKVYSRADAMRVPAIAAARNRVIEHLAGRPLVDHTTTGRAESQPAWLTSTRSVLAISPYQRLVETLDDLIFDGVSAWAVNRGAGGKITGDVVHIPFDRWTQDEYGTVFFDGEEVPEDQVLVIPAASTGLLHAGKDTIEGGLLIERAWRARARNPVPSIILKEREPNSMTQAEAKEWVDAIAEARRNPDGGVMFVPAVIDANFEEHSGESFLENARNAIRIDVANYFNLTAQSVEASKAQSTLTYETAETADAQTTDRMSFWSEPIEARLSLDDVVPSGHRIRFNFEAEHHPLTGTPTED